MLWSCFLVPMVPISARISDLAGWNSRASDTGQQESTVIAGFLKPIAKQAGDVVQLVRTLPCHGRGREFESRRPRHSFQRVRRISLKPSRARKGHVSRPFCSLSGDPQSLIQ